MTVGAVGPDSVSQAEPVLGGLDRTESKPEPHISCYLFMCMTIDHSSLHFMLQSSQITRFSAHYTVLIAILFSASFALAMY